MARNLRRLRMNFFRYIVLLGLAWASLPALAARPMVSDDARIVDTKGCQLESWGRINRQGAHQFWAVPACTPVEGLELTLGGAAERHEGSPRLSDTLAQAKWVLRPLQPNDWGLALSLGRSVKRALPGESDVASHYVNLPLSFSRRDDGLLLHLNLGLRQDKLERKDHATWGASTELLLRPGLQLIAEGFGESGSRPLLHAGLRYWLVPDRVQMDTTYGTQARWGTQQRWITIGVRLLWPPFLP